MAFLISSDWHFNHSNDTNTGGILKFERGNKFATIQEHDRYIVELIRKWLKKLTKDDTFYFLGDFGRPTNETLAELGEIFGKARCKTVAIRGNHDHESETAIMRIFFDEVHDYPVYISDRIILSHRPHVEMDTSVLNISGHLHGSTLNLPNYMCASLHSRLQASKLRASLVLYLSVTFVSSGSGLHLTIGSFRRRKIASMTRMEISTSRRAV